MKKTLINMGYKYNSELNEYEVVKENKRTLINIAEKNIQVKHIIEKKDIILINTINITEMRDILKHI